MKSFVLSIFILALASSEGAAQWKDLGFDNAWVFGAHDTSLFVYHEGGDLYRYVPSAPFGYMQWVVADTGIFPGTADKGVTCFASFGQNFFVGNGGVFLSTDNGSSWVTRFNGLGAGTINCLTVLDSTVFAGVTDVDRSTNYGANWTASVSGIANYHIFALAVSGTTLIAGANGGIFRSTDSGKTWTATSVTVSTTSLAAVGSVIIAGLSTRVGIYRSTDNGLHWLQNDTGICNVLVNSIVTDGKNLFMGTYGNGVYLSTDSGATWDTTNMNTGLPLYGAPSQFIIRNLCVFDTFLVAIAVHDFSPYTASSSIRPISEMVKINTTQGVVQQGEQAKLTISSFPNPLSQSTSIAFTLPEASEVTLTITDATGRETPLLHSARMDAGEHEITWDARKIPSGVYLCRLSSGGASVTERVVVLH